MHVKTSPNVFGILCLYRKTVIFTWVLEGKQTLFIYNNVSHFPRFEKLRPFVKHASDEEGRNVYIESFSIRNKRPLDVITKIGEFIAD